MFVKWGSAYLCAPSRILRARQMGLCGLFIADPGSSRPTYSSTRQRLKQCQQSREREREHLLSHLRLEHRLPPLHLTSSSHRSILQRAVLPSDRLASAQVNEDFIWQSLNGTDRPCRRRSLSRVPAQVLEPIAFVSTMLCYLVCEKHEATDSLH